MKCLRSIGLSFVFFVTCGACSSAQDAKLESASLETLYNDLLASVQWEDGWPSKHDCDGTLWAGIACLGGVDTRISLAEAAPGQTERRPGPSCYPNESKTTTSKDMVTGYMGCLYKKGDLGALERLADYGEAHSWAMGEPASAVGEVLLDPNRQGLLGRLIMALGGRERDYARIVPVHVPVTADYARHLQMIEIYLHGKEHGSISPLMMELIRNNVRSDDGDAFFQALKGRYTGDFDKFQELVSNPNYTFPSYVRGSEEYRKAHLLFALAVALGK